MSEMPTVGETKSHQAIMGLDEGSQSCEAGEEMEM